MLLCKGRLAVLKPTIIYNKIQMVVHLFLSNEKFHLRVWNEGKMHVENSKRNFI